MSLFAVMWTIVGVIVTSVVLLIVALREYETMLITANVPFCMRGGVAEKFLWFLFIVSTKLRVSKPSTHIKRMQQVALEKIQLLEKNPPPPGSVCFIGSSTLTYWRHLDVDMAPLQVPVFNGAFGGSCTDDIILHMEDLCMRYQPQVVVYFCGTNNIAQGMEPKSVLQGLEMFHSRLLNRCPDAHVIYLGITLTPFFIKTNINNAIDKIVTANRIVKEYCNRVENASKVTFVSTDECSFARNPMYYLGDMHHLNDDGHSELGAILLPVICSFITSYG